MNNLTFSSIHLKNFIRSLKRKNKNISTPTMISFRYFFATESSLFINSFKNVNVAFLVEA